MKEEENKDWNEFWSKYTSFKIDTEWLETNYPEVLKAWKEHRQPIILERVYQKEQSKKREAQRLLKKFAEVEKWLDSLQSGISEDVEKAIRLSLELGTNDEDNRHKYWTAITSLARHIEGYPVRRGRSSEEE
tara:strand:- start:3526 stop:3921 length:396 start_codon:yes stop_codon:yes gene_type:complete